MESNKSKDIKYYVDELTEDIDFGMSLVKFTYDSTDGELSKEVISEFENRLDWLQNKPRNVREFDIWRTIAREGEHNLLNCEEVVFIEIESWFVKKDDMLRHILSDSNDMDFRYFAVLDTDACEDKDAYSIKSIRKSKYNWKEPISNQYIWIPKSVCNVYQKVGDVNPLDKEKVRFRDAKESVDDEEISDYGDYNWRYAIGCAYRRCINKKNTPLEEAVEKARDNPKSVYEPIEIGVNEYMNQAQMNNKNVNPDELAMVIESLIKAVKSR